MELSDTTYQSTEEPRLGPVHTDSSGRPNGKEDPALGAGTGPVESRRDANHSVGRPTGGYRGADGPHPRAAERRPAVTVIAVICHYRGH